MKTYYNIMDFGAVSGSNELQTAQIQAAVDAAFLAGGGEVIVPAGIFKTATIRLRSNVIFHMLSGAVLEGSTNPDDYEFRLDDPLQPIDPADGVDTDCRRGTFLDPWYRSILWGFQAENIKILGEKDSVIDGKNVFDPQGEEGYRGPQAIQLMCFALHAVNIGVGCIRGHIGNNLLDSSGFLLCRQFKLKTTLPNLLLYSSTG